MNYEILLLHQEQPHFAGLCKHSLCLLLLLRECKLLPGGSSSSLVRNPHRFPKPANVVVLLCLLGVRVQSPGQKGGHTTQPAESAENQASCIRARVWPVCWAPGEGWGLLSKPRWGRVGSSWFRVCVCGFVSFSPGFL